MGIWFIMEGKTTVEGFLDKALATKNHLEFKDLTSPT